MRYTWAASSIILTPSLISSIPSVAWRGTGGGSGIDSDPDSDICFRSFLTMAALAAEVMLEGCCSLAADDDKPIGGEMNEMPSLDDDTIAALASFASA